MVLNEFGQAVGDPLPEWKGARPPERIVIEGRYVRLEPVNVERHAHDLHAAYQDATDEPIWTYINVGPFDTEADYRAFLTTAARSTDPMHFALVDQATNKPLGTFSLMRVDAASGSIEVGFVLYSPRLRRTRMATEAMFLLMRYVFDELGYRRFEWKCDDLNTPSRKAAARYGFEYEGTFRKVVVYKNRNRDTAWFAIIDSDWPALRACYERWLSPDNFDANGQQREALSTLIESRPR